MINNTALQRTVKAISQACAVRINPREAQINAPHISLPYPALAALEMFEQHLDTMII